MKHTTFKICRSLAFLLALITVIALFSACDLLKGGDDTADNGENNVPHVDYVSELKLDMSSETIKQEVTVKTYIDGDTTHFNFPGFGTQNTLKARYLAINTPESTGQIEEWGKKASNFTKEALKSATSIIIESDDGQWNADSTGDRYMVWVWYRTSDDADYRNLNLEILQNGLAIASNSNNNRYGDICMKAIAQAKAEKLHVNSGEKDPDFFYGTAQEITLKELRTHIADYNGVKVAFEGVVTQLDAQSVYVEAYDEETDFYYGIYVYYGFGLKNMGKEIITSVGSLIRVVGTVSYWETGNSYQVSDISYNLMKPNDPNNVQYIEKGGHAPAYLETTIDTFKSKVTLTLTQTDEDGEEVEVQKTFDYAELALGTSRLFKNLTVVDVYTTHNGGDNDGAMTLTCRDENGKTMTVRTAVLNQADGETLVTEEEFFGKTMDVYGVVDSYDGEYQLKLFSMSGVVFH